MSASPTPVESPGSQTPTELIPLRTGVIDAQYTTPALDYRSTGTYLVWSSGARSAPENTAPDLFGSTPGGVVRLLYDNPNRDSRLEVVGGDGERIAFIEVTSDRLGPPGWLLWYLADPDATPVLIDHGWGTLPSFAFSDDRMVWTTYGGIAPTLSQLVLLDLRSMKRRVLRSSTIDRAEYFFPDIDGNRVVYGAVEWTPDRLSEERHVYLLDVVDGPAIPRRLDDSRSASEPVIEGDVVVWKESDHSQHFLNGGGLVRYSISTGVTSPLVLGLRPARYTFPTLAGRYATAWSDDERALYLADIQNGEIVRVIDLGTTEEDPHDAVARPNLAGNVLTYVFGPGGGDLELRWVVLP